MNVHIPWIKITLSSGMSLTWRSNPESPDYFTSLTNKRTIEQAATMDINITYCPKIGEDCNRIEKAIAESPTCTVQYGDSYGSRQVASRVYKGLIYSYSISFNEGYLSYSLKIVSSSASYNFKKCEEVKIPEEGYHPIIGDRLVVGQVEGTTGGISKTIKHIVETYMTDYVYDEESSNSALGDLSEVLYSADNPLHLAAGQSPLKVILQLVKVVPTKDSGILVLEIDDAINNSGKGTVRVVKSMSTESKSQELSFEWGTKNGQVLSWSPNYNGSVAIFRYNDKAGVSATSCYDATTGKPAIITYHVASSAAGALISADTRSSAYKTALNMNEFKKIADYPYCATLTVLGEDRFISPAQTKINVTPVIMGVAHHSAGVYAAKSIIDKVSGSEGFTTTYELYRLTDNGESTTKKKESSDKADEGASVWYNGRFIPYEEFDSTMGFI